MKKIISLALTAAIALAGEAWYIINNNKEIKSNVIPYSANKDKEIAFGHYCKTGKFTKYYKIKTIIWQENPCFAAASDLNAKKIDDHTVEIVTPDGEGYFTIGDEMVIDPKSDGELILGNQNCEESYNGKEVWTTYYYDNGKWKYGCKTTFVFK